MPFFLYLVLSYVVPVALVLGCAAVWWRSLSAPWLFLGVGYLALVGLQRVLSGAWSLARLGLGSGGFYLEQKSTLPEGPLLLEASAIAAATTLVGLGILWALRHALAKL
ncbi:hypothetical protein [Hydrogenophaga sp.]|uniref:hypothetical protein n=1 Tax=Hydrogenophaga sp. TaxID=1904254 RepID=UPI00273375BD|nr:hypothetical protein [Hydrogenophaga sp.]MDP3887414.1 hypothetical protein [Hydrogenophaga sp.]